ncbi:MAG TPA: HNH endonuclease [Thermomicrobiales bacterium]|nr:HNH endonuclease [Thermomicrobiales bacterium]
MTQRTEPLQPVATRQMVLVLNQNYEPLNVCNMRRAIGLILHQKAEVLDVYQIPIVTATRTIDAPSVIRLSHLIRRPHPRVKLTRREIFIRDNYTCQYCGTHSGDLTIDHIVPRSRGGAHSWENLVSACRPCNHRKGGKLLNDSKMRLNRQPFEPKAGRYYTIQRRLNAAASDAWLKFIPGFESIQLGAIHSSASD